MSNPSFYSPRKRRKPELLSVRVIAWDEGQGLYGLFYEFDDGETFGEVWGSREDAELAARIRMQDVRPLRSRPGVN